MSALAHRRALVLGAHREPGGAVAVALARAGAALVCADRRLAGETVATIRGAGGRAETWQCDIADAQSIEALFDALGESGLPLDIVVVVLAPPGPCGLTAAPEAIDGAIAASLRGVWLAAGAAARAMAGRGGRILLVLPGGADAPLAAAMRAAVAALVPGWAGEAGPRVTLAAIAPDPGARVEATAALAVHLAGPAGAGLSGQVLASGAAPA